MTKKIVREYKVPLSKVLSENISFVDLARNKILYNDLSFLFNLAIDKDTKRELFFLNQLIKKFRPDSKTILDLGCGCGRISNPLSEIYGFKVTGVDISSSQINNAKKTKTKAKHLVRDIRKLDSIGLFDVAICMWTTFNYLSTVEDVSAFISSLNKCLHKDGIFILDINNPLNINESPYSRNTSNNQFEMNLSIKKRKIGNILHGTYIYFLTDFTQNIQYVITDQEIHMLYNVEDLDYYFDSCFDLVGAYGDYDIKNKFSRKSSRRIIAVYRKASGFIK